jgi:hypothetical protein
MDKLLLSGDFNMLGYSQKMRLFQVALQTRQTITITTDLANSLDTQQCVIFASSVRSLEWITCNFPVCLR